MRGFKMTVALLAGLFVAAHAGAISPPQYTLQRQIKNTIGLNRCISVGEVYQEPGVEEYHIDITVCSAKVAGSLGVVIPLEYNFGGIPVAIHIISPDGTELAPCVDEAELGAVTDIRKHFLNVLEDNPLFVKIHRLPSEIPMAPDLMIEVAAEVVQYWNDNLSDYYGNNNEVAAYVFASICKETFRGGKVVVWWSTQPKSAGR